MNAESTGKKLLAFAVAACIAHSACANPVVWLHGWNSDGSLWDDLQSRMVKSAGASSADFLTLSYYGGELGFSTDTPIEEVAAAVARRIQDFHDSCGERVDVVCHSMGGLVFRSLIAQECLADPSIVRRYVAIGTPHYGQDASASYQAKQMKYGSDFLWRLGEAWHFNGLAWPASDTLCIAGITDMYVGGASVNGSYWDGLVHAWSAALGGGVPTRYVYRCHSRALNVWPYAKAEGLCSVPDGSKDAVYCLIRDFLMEGSVPDELAPTYGGDDDSDDLPGWVKKENKLWAVFMQVLSAADCTPFSYTQAGYLYRYQVDGKTPEDNYKEYGEDGVTSGYAEGIVQVFGNLPTGGVHRVAFERPDGTRFDVPQAIAPEPGSCRFIRVYDGAEPAIKTMDADGPVDVPLSWLSSNGLVVDVNCLTACTNALVGEGVNGYTGAACWRYGLDPLNAAARAWIPALGIVLTGGKVFLEFDEAENAARVHVQSSATPNGPFADVDDAGLTRSAGELSLPAEQSATSEFFRLYRR